MILQILEPSSNQGLSLLPLHGRDAIDPQGIGPEMAAQTPLGPLLSVRTPWPWVGRKAVLRPLWQSNRVEKTHRSSCWPRPSCLCLPSMEARCVSEGASEDSDLQPASCSKRCHVDRDMISPLSSAQTADL